MHIALIQLPHFYGEGLSRPPECYPLGLGYLSSVLTQKGISHAGVDLWGHQYSTEDALAKIDFSAFDLFAISAYSTQYKYLKEFSLRLKGRYPGVPIVCGGPGATFSYETILRKTGVDVCVLGEGEETFVDLCLHLDSPGEVAGLSFIDNGEVRVTAARPYIADLDTIPLPNRELFDFRLIMSVANQVRAEQDSPELRDNPRRSADIIAGRGCPYNCHYCSKTFKGVRLRSIDNIVREILDIREKYAVNHLLFNDELVLVNKKRTLALCAELKKLDLTWSCQGRINQVDEEILTAMKEAGCISIGYGVESISQTILDRMNKNLDAGTIVPVIKLTQKIGIQSLVQYMYGYPGENDATIAATEKFFAEVDYPFVGFTTTPIPGTQLYRECLQQNRITDEEDYLLRLDSGYNLNGALINMTEFSDEEFLRKKRRLYIRISHNYLKKRPLLYLQFIVGTVKRKIARFFRRIAER